MAARKGFLYRITMGKDNQPDFDPSKLPSTRWAQFADIFKMRFGNLIKVNLLALIFCLPAIAWVVIVGILRVANTGILPFSANIGIGYPVVDNVTQLADALNFSLDMQLYLVLVPLIMIACVGLAGAFNAFKMMAWNEGATVTSTFFKGIKQSFGQFLWIGLFLGLALLLLMFNISSYGMLSIPKVLQIIGICITIVLFVIVICMAIFLCTQSVTYKLNLFHLIKNSFLFAIGLLPTNLIFIILSVGPIVLLFFLASLISAFSFIVYFIAALLGFSFIILIWTLYAHYVFDRFVNGSVEGAVKNKGLYIKTDEDKQRDEERKRKANNIRFANPRKKKPVKSIEEGSDITPLAASFSRVDLAKLAAEKEQVKAEIDLEYTDVDNLDNEQDN